MALPFNITIIVSSYVHNAKCTVQCIVLWSAISKQCYAPFLFTHFHHFLSCQVKNFLRDSFYLCTYWSILVINYLLENWFYRLTSNLNSERVSKDLPRKCLYHTMRRNLLNWCNLVSISKKLMFYVFWVVRLY